MNIMNKHFNLVVLLVAIISFTSCNKDSFLNVNDDPNRVTETTVTPYLIFPFLPAWPSLIWMTL